MEKIVIGKKTATGMALVWREERRDNEETFTFSELESMRIPVQGLLDNPGLYRIDLQEHKVYVSQLGRGI